LSSITNSYFSIIYKQIIPKLELIAPEWPEANEHRPPVPEEQLIIAQRFIAG